MKVFIDTSFFKALVDPKDDFHPEALRIWETLRRKEVNFVTSNYILDEVFTLLRARCGIKTVLEFKKIIAQSASIIKIVRITVADEILAWEWFDKDWSKLSFTDCTSFAICKRLRIKKALFFDIHFKRAGLETLK